MEPHRQDDHEHQTNLGSPEYRTRLLTKLNCLIAVLEVAIAKVDRSLESPGANEERLTRVRSNLDNTLSICHRAKRTLDRALGAVRRGPETADDEDGRMSYRDYVELSSIDEYRKFRDLPPISDNELSEVDLDELTRKLGED